jgi:hypothetical protein
MEDLKMNILKDTEALYIKLGLLLKEVKDLKMLQVKIVHDTIAKRIYYSKIEF